MTDQYAEEDKILLKVASRCVYILPGSETGPRPNLRFSTV